MTGKGNVIKVSFVAAAEQVCLQPVLEPRQRRGRRNTAWLAIPHLCSINKKGTTSDLLRWQADFLLLGSVLAEELRIA